MIRDEIMVRILSGYSLPITGIHGLPHWGRVLENGLRLAKSTGADTRVVTLFAILHDARRVNEISDPDHGRRGAELATEMRSLLEVTDDQFAQLALACTHHTDGTTEGDATVRTCWDADRLDLWRVGITPREPWLCTEAAGDAEILAWSRHRSITDHVPDWTEVWIDAAERSD